MKHLKTFGHGPQKQIRLEKGVVYFTTTFERRIFFFLTLVMLGAGLVAHLT